MFGQEFATPEPHIRAGFDRVFAGVGVAKTIARDLREAYIPAHRSGDPRQEQRVFDQHLGNARWEWPWYDEWRERFAAAGIWPHMWRAHARLQRAAQEGPADKSEALELFTAKELKAWLVEHDLLPRPVPRTADDIQDVFFGRSFPWALFEPLARERHQRQVTDEGKGDLKDERQYLLCHTVAMTVYHCRDAAKQVPPGWSRRLSIVPPDDQVPGFAEAAARFDWRDLDTWPPFYPGDRTGVIGVSPYRRSG